MTHRRTLHRTRPTLWRDAQTVVAASDDGALWFTLVRRMDSVQAERVHQRVGQGRIVLSVRFNDDVAFLRWCDADRLKYTYPLLFAQLRRNASALFQQRTDPATKLA